MRPPDLTKFGTIGLGEGVAYYTAGMEVSFNFTKNLSVTADWAAGFGSATCTLATNTPLGWPESGSNGHPVGPAPSGPGSSFIDQ